MLFWGQKERINSWMIPLRFSTKHKAKHGWKLYKDNTLIERVDNVYHYCPSVWILGDVNPWFEGVHCWRIRIMNPKKGWVSIGVCNM